MNKKPEIINAFKDFVKKNKRLPNTREFLEYQISRTAIRHNFGSISQLKTYMKEEHPECFKGVISDSLFDPQKFKQINDLVKGSNRFVITTAVVNSPIHTKFFKTLKVYCKANKSTLLIVPCANPGQGDDWILDPALANEHIIGHDLSLNKNIHIRMIQLSAKQIDPTTGLSRLSQKDGAFIYASPKQRLQFIPTGNEKLPHPIMTTGAVTSADYETDVYMSKRTSYLANFDHVLGALIVELDPEGKYFYRQVQAEPNTGRFFDLGKYYSPNGKIEKLGAEALIMGDYHAGEHELSAKQAWKEVCSEVGVRNLVGHDVFNGKWNNHHDMNKTVTKAQLSEDKRMGLEEELSIVNTEVSELLTWIPGKFIFVKSNHDEVLDRYLQDGRYLTDPSNLRFASQLIAPMIDRKDPLAYALVNLPKLSNKKVAELKEFRRIIFLKRDESFKIAGVELGSHGDKGANGSKGGSLLTFEKAYGPCVIGHAHTPEVLRSVWRVGTTSKLKLDYNVGASSWFHTSCLLYSDGSRQMINSINGKWRLK